MSEKVFANGMIFKLPHQNAPEFVKGKVSININEFVQFLQQNNNNGWVNIDLKVSKGGKAYAELDTYGQQQQQFNQPPQQNQQQGFYQQPTGQPNIQFANKDHLGGFSFGG